jgi:hypothetical protein
VERASQASLRKESWIESESGNEDSAGEKSGEASPSSVALGLEWGTPVAKPTCKARSNFLSYPKTQILIRSCVAELSAVERG